MPETTIKRARKAAKAPPDIKKRDKVVAPTKTPVTPKQVPIGRPVEFTDAIADEICWRLTHGEPLVQICKDAHLPHVATIYRWLIRFPIFCDMYARAREDQADTNADEILQIADEHPPEHTDEKGRTSLDMTYIQWQKNRIEARKWTAAKLKPRKYGDRFAVEGVEGGAAIKTEDTSANKFLEVIKNMEMTKRGG